MIAGLKSAGIEMSTTLLRRAATKIATKLGMGSAAFLLGSDPSRNFSNQWYIRHNQRRQEHLASLGLDLFNKTVLETGAGIGDHSSFFIDRGCTLTITEPREDNLKILRERYTEQKIVQLDLDSPDKQFDIKFDIVYCYGTLYHLCRPAIALEFLAKQTGGILLLETCVSPGDEINEYLIAEDKNLPTQAVSGTGCRPTRSWLQQELQKYFKYVYFPITQPCHPEFPLNWNKPNEKTLNRAIVVASNNELRLPVLSTEIRKQQSWQL